MIIETRGHLTRQLALTLAAGGAVLRHPYNSIAWLAWKLAQFGERVKAGDTIMSGSFARQFPLAAGDRVEASFTGICTITAGVT